MLNVALCNSLSFKSGINFFEIPPLLQIIKQSVKIYMENQGFCSLLNLNILYLACPHINTQQTNSNNNNYHLQ